jgi:hypothetical protein
MKMIGSLTSKSTIGNSRILYNPSSIYGVGLMSGPGEGSQGPSEGISQPENKQIGMLVEPEDGTVAPSDKSEEKNIPGGVKIVAGLAIAFVAYKLVTK